MKAPALPKDLEPPYSQLRLANAGSSTRNTRARAGRMSSPLGIPTPGFRIPGFCRMLSLEGLDLKTSPEGPGTS